MLKRNSELRASALESLKGKWGSAVVVNLVYILLAIVMGSVLGIISVLSGLTFLSDLAGLLLLPIIIPIAWGLIVLFLDNYRGEKIEVKRLFDGFNDYGRILGTSLLMYLYLILWSLLLYIPGIIKGYSYGMTSYILKDEPELKFNAAIEKSMEMMSGHKMKLFLLDLSFIGWWFLSILTLGIGTLWLAPYWFSARAAFYEDLKNEATLAEQV